MGGKAGKLTARGLVDSETRIHEDRSSPACSPSPSALLSLQEEFLFLVQGLVCARIGKGLPSSQLRTIPGLQRSLRGSKFGLQAMQ